MNILVIVFIYCWGDVRSPEYIHKYAFLYVFGRANPAPTVGGNAIGRLDMTAVGQTMLLRWICMLWWFFPGMGLETASGSSASEAAASEAATSETSSAESSTASATATEKSSAHSADKRTSSAGTFVILIS